MSTDVKLELISFDDAKVRIAAPEEAGQPRALVAYLGAELALGEVAKSILAEAQPQITRAAAAAKFTGKSGTSLEILAPAGLPGVSRLVLIGIGPAQAAEGEKPRAFDDFLALGGQTAAKLGEGSRALTLLDFPQAPSEPLKAAGQLALGALLRAYKFERYKTRKKKDAAEREGAIELALAVADTSAAAPAISEAARPRRRRVMLARISSTSRPTCCIPRNSPAARASSRKLGVEVEVLDEAAMAKLGMGALLGVGQGSEQREPPGGHALERRQARRDAGRLHRQGRLLRHRRHLDQARRRHGGHEGRHGGRRLRRRPDARARRAQGQGQRRRRHRPGREHAGRQRAAPGRHRHLDVRARPSRSSTPTPRAGSCWPTCCGTCKEQFKPKFMVDLATLTGAIIVALGQEYAGLFSNNDELAERLTQGRRGDRRDACGACRSDPNTTS